MKNLILITVIILSCLVASSQSMENYTADAGPSFTSSTTKNLVLLIGADPLSKVTESIEKDRLNVAPGTIKYYGVQYLYLQNKTVFSDPVTKKIPIEIVSQSNNKLVFKLPQVREKMLEINLATIHESVIQIGVQIATISFQ